MNKVGWVVVVALVLTAVGPAEAAVPPYASDEAGTYRYAYDQGYAPGLPGTASASGEATADAITGRLVASGEASDSFPLGGVGLAYVSGAYGGSEAWIERTRTVPPGDYVLLAKFKDAVAQSQTQTALGPLPVANVEWADTYGHVSLTGGCSGCSASAPQYVRLDGMSRTMTLVMAVTVPATVPSAALTVRALIAGQASVGGRASASINASTLIERISILRGEQEV